MGDRFPRLSLLQQDGRFDLCDGEPLFGVPPIALPDRRTCERCGVTFFNHINSVVYILTPEKFFNSVEAIYSGRDITPSAQATIHLIVALVDSCSESFEIARMQMESVMEEGSLESIQAIMLMVRQRSPCHGIS